MPRTRRYQPAQAVASQAYGEKTEQLDAQRQMPLPQNDPGQPAAPQDGPGPPDVLALAAGFQPGVVPLSAGSGRPGEPVTAGLPVGAGPGPEVLPGSLFPQRSNAAIDQLQLLADITGDPYLATLLQRARGGAGGY